MKKNKLIASFDFDFSLLAIASQLKEYKLAWIINQELGINLVKQQDEIFHFLGDEKLSISNYLYQTEHSSIRLIMNRSRDESSMQPLIPELKQFDFLMLIEGFEDTLVIQEVQDTLKNINGIQLINQIIVDQLKSRDNLIF
ncbi:MAG: IPExxxVDY family protein [Bacteroidetes bacterium]|nr:MAG: IPExxxVDY family protein [Bacteroidota bacterium]